jgi:hypothetical protein
MTSPRIQSIAAMRFVGRHVFAAGAAARSAAAIAATGAAMAHSFRSSPLRQ